LRSDVQSEGREEGQDQARDQAGERQAANFCRHISHCAYISYINGIWLSNDPPVLARKKGEIPPGLHL
jgi:hypothetical protein